MTLKPHHPKLIHLLVALALACAGCTTPSGPPVDEFGNPYGDYGYGTSKELNELLQRDNAETILAQRDAMITTITTELTHLMPGSTWKPSRKGDSFSCGEFGSTQGQIYSSPNYISEVMLPGKLWDTAADLVTTLAAPYGYTTITTRTPQEDALLDDGTNHIARLVINGPYSSTLEFGSLEQALLQVTTGCFLTAADKQAALDHKPTPTTTP
ncbi:MAG: LppA family lipoprotein [Mycobacteriaceae bacterium]